MSYYNLISLMPKTAPIDPDAQAFITAASITDPTQQSAINQLVVDLKGYSIWSKMKAIYPFVGGTAAQHKWNLKDPRDLDAAFRLVFNGGWTHSSNGATPNGTNAFANTFYNTSTQSTTSNISAGFYSRTNTTSGGTTFGVTDGSFTGLALVIKFTDNNTYFGANDSFLTGSGNFISNTTGLFVINRTSLTEKKMYRNGSVISTSTPTSNGVKNDVVYLGARRYGGYTVDSYDTRQHSFTFLGDTLSDTEAANFYTAVQAFQTTLGRQV